MNRLLLVIVLACGMVSACSPAPPSGVSAGSSIIPAAVSASTGAEGITFTNHTAQFVWVSFTLRDCHNVSPVGACESTAWYKTISLSPRSQQAAAARCAFDSNSPASAALAYTVQWTAYVDTSGGNLNQPTALPPYTPSAGTFTRESQDSAYSLLETCLNAGM